MQFTALYTAFRLTEYRLVSGLPIKVNDVESKKGLSVYLKITITSIWLMIGISMPFT